MFDEFMRFIFDNLMGVVAVILIGLVLLYTFTSPPNDAEISSKKIKGFFRSAFGIFVPRFEEIHLWTMSLTIVLAILFNLQSIRVFLYENYPVDEFFPAVFGLIFLLTSMAFAIYHSFVEGEKGGIAKFFMLFFAVFYTLIVGGTAASLAFNKAEGWLKIFPAINGINILAMFLLFRFGAIDEQDISNEDITLPELSISTVVIVFAFVISNNVIGNPWAVTLSICMALSYNLSTPIARVYSFVKG